jgi:hypothetical protein
LDAPRDHFPAIRGKVHLLNRAKSTAAQIAAGLFARKWLWACLSAAAAAAVFFSFFSLEMESRNDV